MHPPGNDPANAPGKAGSLVDLAGLWLVRRWPRAPVPWTRIVGRGRLRNDPTFAGLACSAVSAPGGCITRCVCRLPHGRDLRGRSSTTSWADHLLRLVQVDCRCFLEVRPPSPPLREWVALGIMRHLKIRRFCDPDDDLVDLTGETAQHVVPWCCWSSP